MGNFQKQAIGRALRSTEDYTDVLISIKVKNSGYQFLQERTLWRMTCQRTDLLGMMREMEILKAWCNGKANRQGFALKDVELIIETTDTLY